MDKGDPVIVHLADCSRPSHSEIKQEVKYLWTGQTVLLSSTGLTSGSFWKNGQRLHDGQELTFRIDNFKWENNGVYQFTAEVPYLTGFAAGPASGCYLVAIGRPLGGGSGFCLIPVDHRGNGGFYKWRMLQGSEVHFLAVTHPRHNLHHQRTGLKYMWSINEEKAQVEEKVVVGATESQNPGTKHITCQPRYRGQDMQGREKITLEITEPSTIERGVVWLKMNLVAAKGHVFHWSQSDKWPVCRRGVIAGGRMEFICACQDDQLLHEWYFQGKSVQQSKSKTESRLILEKVGHSDHGEYHCKHPRRLSTDHTVLAIQQLSLADEESQHCFLTVLEPTMKQSTWDVYMKQLSEGSTIIHEQRIILCGPGRAGKTSVKRSLFGEKFTPQLDSTVGMELSRACCTVECTNEGMKWAKVEDEDEHRDMLLTNAISQCAAQELGSDILQESLWVARDDDPTQQGHGVSGTRQDGREQRQPEEDLSKKCVREEDMGEPAGWRRDMKTPRQISEHQFNTIQGGADLQPRAGKRQAPMEETQRGEGGAEDAKRAKRLREEKIEIQMLTFIGSNEKETSPMDRHLCVPTSDVPAMSDPSSSCVSTDQHRGVSQFRMEELHIQQSPTVTANLTGTSLQSDSHGLAFSTSDQFHSTSVNSPALGSAIMKPKPPSGVSLEPQLTKAPPQVILEQPQQLKDTARSAIKAAELRIRNIRRNVSLVTRAASMIWRFVTLWDFAGQEAFAIVQHLLMSHMRTAYGVVYNAQWPLDDIAKENFGTKGQEMAVMRETTRKESNFDVLTGWLDVLHHVFSRSTDTNYSPLLYIICTHADEMPIRQRPAFRQEILKRIEGKPYEPDVRDVVFVDNTRSGEQVGEDPTIVMLKREFITAMQSDSSMQIPIPLKWLPFVVSMRKLADNQGCPIVPLQQVEEIATIACTTDNAEETAALIAFCHSLGHILHFTDNERLSQKVVINVEWLVKVVSLLFVPIDVYEKLPSNRQFAAHYRLLYKQGILQETLAVHIWSHNLPLGYAKQLQVQELRTYLFELMEEYSLLISASDSSTMPGDKSTRKYWVPAMVGVEHPEDKEEDAAFSRMEKDSKTSPVRRSLPVYLHCSDGHQFPRSLFWRLVARCMQHYRQVGDLERARPILYRSSIRLLCDADHWLLLRRYQYGLQVIIEQEESPLKDQNSLSTVCHSVLTIVEGELASLVKIYFGKFSWCLSARCRCSMDADCNNHHQAHCPFVDCQHFVPLDKPRCCHPLGMQQRQDVSAVQNLWLSKEVSEGELLANESSVLPAAANICAAITHHFELFQELISAKLFLRPFYEEMLLSAGVVKAVNCAASKEDANRQLLEAVIASNNSRTLAMFLTLLGKHGLVGLVETLLSCPGANCQVGCNSYHTNNPALLQDGASLPAPLQQPIATVGLPSEPSQLASGSVLNEADPQLFELAQQLAFSNFELKYFAQLLLQNSGCHQDGEVFLASLNMYEYTTVPHKTHAVLQYWIKAAPGPSYRRYGCQLKDVLEKAEKNNVIRDFEAYLNGSSGAMSTCARSASTVTDHSASCC